MGNIVEYINVVDCIYLRVCFSVVTSKNSEWTQKDVTSPAISSPSRYSLCLEVVTGRISSLRVKIYRTESWLES